MFVFFNNLSNMSKFYILEFFAFLIIFIVSIIIVHNKSKNQVVSASNEIPEGKHSKTYKKSHKSILIIMPLCFVLIIGLEYIFEMPQVDGIINLEVNSEISENTIKVMYHNNNIFTNIQDEQNIDTSNLGESNIDLKIPYLGNYISKNIKINIIDTTAPEITTDYKDNDEVSYTVDLKTQGFKAIDNYDKDLTSKVEVSTIDLENNMKKVSYKILDSSGNVAQKDLTLKIIDDVKPEIKLNGNSSVTIIVGSTYNDEGAIASDEKDGDLTDKIKIDSSVDSSKIGEYSVKYSVSDNSGNQAELSRTVYVITNQSSDNQENSNGVIYLTFDDGPSSSITPKILDVLKKKGVKATFFIVNYSDANEYLIKREASEGHSIGIHGYSHEYSAIYTSVSAFMNNITKLRTKLRNSTGIDSTIIRFPGGSSNTVSKNYCSGIMTTLTKKVVAEGYSYFDWNVSSGDAGGISSSTEAYNNVVNHLSKNRANVVLMHDFSGNTKSLNALPSIIDYGLSHGFKFSRITKSTPMVTHHVNN